MSEHKPTDTTPHSISNHPLCPECGRLKADSADDVILGKCSKWWSVRDPEAANACAKLTRLVAAPD